MESTEQASICHGLTRHPKRSRRVGRGHELPRTRPAPQRKGDKRAPCMPRRSLLDDILAAEMPFIFFLSDAAHTMPIARFRDSRSVASAFGPWPWVRPFLPFARRSFASLNLSRGVAVDQETTKCASTLTRGCRLVGPTRRMIICWPGSLVGSLRRGGLRLKRQFEKSTVIRWAPSLARDAAWRNRDPAIASHRIESGRIEFQLREINTMLFRRFCAVCAARRDATLSLRNLPFPGENTCPRC